VLFWALVTVWDIVLGYKDRCELELNVYVLYLRTCLCCCAYCSFYMPVVLTWLWLARYTDPSTFNKPFDTTIKQQGRKVTTKLKHCIYIYILTDIRFWKPWTIHEI